ncbi:MAG: hypothetical protein ACFFC7_27975 [Candidatus Hermodarchaeota archaeon]
MGEKSLIVTLIWDGNDFIILEMNVDPSDEATLLIDESQGITFLQIPERYGIVQKRTMQRRAQSIAKSGFQYTPDLRIGMNNELVIEAKEEISGVLLQVGHGFRADHNGEHPEPYNVKLTESEPEYYSEETSRGQESISLSESTPITTMREPLGLLGQFIMNLVNIVGEVLLTKKTDHYIVEYGFGKVIFTAENGIKIISSTGSSDDEYAMKQALEATLGV